MQRCGVVVLDHTYRLAIDGAGHLNANRFVQQIQRMRAEHLLEDEILSKPRAIRGCRLFAHVNDSTAVDATSWERSKMG